MLNDHFVYASVYLQEIAGRHRSAEWSAMDKEYVTCLERIIQEGIDRGDFSPTLNPRIATLAIIGSLNWLTHWYQPDGPLSPTEIADNFTDLFLAGMLLRRAVGPATKRLEPPRPVKRPRAKPAS